MITLYKDSVYGKLWLLKGELEEEEVEGECGEGVVEWAGAE